MQPVEREGGGF